MSENQRDPQYKLRWSEDLRQKVAQSAKEHNRSMNADIVARLEQSFEEFTYKDQELKFLKEMNEARAKDIDKLIGMVEQLLDEKKDQSEIKKAP